MGSGISCEWSTEQEEYVLKKYEELYPSGSEMGLPHVSKKQFSQMADELNEEIEAVSNAWQVVQQLLYRKYCVAKTVEWYSIVTIILCTYSIIVHWNVQSKDCAVNVIYQNI